MTGPFTLTHRTALALYGSGWPAMAWMHRRVNGREVVWSKSSVTPP
ncbi:MAG: hypothetical protein JWP30_36 [Homoserinimonas sp.]|jgi:hypothetical protein|nr:hypothetical protein [Homoserinimonas sp.]